jgi:hypothetical protein
MRREAGNRNAIVTEAADQNRPWLRWLSEDRLMFAGGLSSTPPTRLRETLLKQRTAELMYELSVRYPAISGLPARWAWETEVVTAVDGLPWIGPHRNYPFHFFRWPTAGMATAWPWHAARAALRYFKGEATRGGRRARFCAASGIARA